MNIYDVRRYGTVIFLIISVGVVGLFLYVSSSLVNDLSQQERERMQIWADATKEMAKQTFDPEAGGIDDANIEFLWSIIESNHTIPVLLTDDNGEILDQRNFDLPEPIDSMQPYYISEVNRTFLYGRLEALRGGPNVIHIIISADNFQHLYYEDSKLLKRLSYFPYIQLLVMLAFIVVVYFAVLSTKKAEQNKVWVGLSKETAHQLGTPISSLMAWMELLKSLGVDEDTVAEMDKDVNRLSTIASRFSKIGSKPQMEHADLNTVVDRAASYMATRISARISLTVSLSAGAVPVLVSPPLFEWVMENLIKNAVDAMPDGRGAINVVTGIDGGKAFVQVSDTGKGIPRKNFKTIFNPGFTTKTRGWGLGLTLARRIIDQYHSGHIYVASSELGRGTTFRIDLPLDRGQ